MKLLRSEYEHKIYSKLWDSYPPDSADLSDNTISVISIFGTTNNFPNTENFNDKKHLLPADTLFIGIEGANHAQFGDNGPQKGDVVGSISLAEQHERVTEIMLDFIFPESIITRPLMP